MARKALGKGLSSLIKVDTTIKGTTTEAMGSELLMTQIVVNKNQPRKLFDEDRLNELADSIKQFGVLEPIIVQKKGIQYQIIAGERRFRAAVKVGLKKIPVVLRGDLTEEQVMQISLIENLQREDINPIDAAMAFKKLIESFNYTHEDLSLRLNKDRSTITNTLRLLELPKSIQNDLSQQRMTLTQARPLLGLKDSKEMMALRDAIIHNSYSVRQIEHLVREKKANAGTIVKKKPKKDVHVRNMEKELMYKLKTKVSINDQNGKGKIEIDYFSYDDFDRIRKSFK